MKKTIMMFAMLLTISTTGLAQQREGTLTIQPKVGMNISNLTDADKSIIDWNFGLEGEYMLTDKFSLAAGIFISNQGAKYKSDDGDYTADLDYVNVPIMANYYLLPGLAIKAGVQPGFKTKAKAITDGGSVDLDIFYGTVNEGLGTDIKISPMDFSIPVGISYEYANFVLDARYNWGLVKIMNMGDAFYNRVFMVTLGYKLGFDL